MQEERRLAVLRAIVEDYVATEEPVGSKALVERHGLGVSPATVRNEMAALEDDGYIAQPHTSAGRVPTDLGYRYYVEVLMREERVPDDLRQMIRHQFHQAARELEEWARLSAAILAGRLQNAAIVTTPHSPEPRLRWLELVSVHDYLALLVVVLEEARVLQQTLALDKPISQEELTGIARQLNELLAGKSAAQIREQRLLAAPVESTIAGATAGLIESTEEGGVEAGFLEGLRELLRQPEFTHGEGVLALLESLDERNLAQSIPQQTPLGAAVRIIIGEEHPVDAMRVCSVITTRYAGPSGLR